MQFLKQTSFQIGWPHKSFTLRLEYAYFFTFVLRFISYLTWNSGNQGKYPGVRQPILSRSFWWLLVGLCYHVNRWVSIYVLNSIDNSRLFSFNSNIKGLMEQPGPDVSFWCVSISDIFVFRFFLTCLRNTWLAKPREARAGWKALFIRIVASNELIKRFLNKATILMSMVFS